MKVIPRQEWTSQPCRVNGGSDKVTDLAWFRNPVGIEFVSTPHNLLLNEISPAVHYGSLLDEALSLGHSDIDYNLGVAGNVNGVWCLRGLQNKSSFSTDPNYNALFVSVYISIGSEEKPTDTLLRNVLEARRLVVSRYLSAEEIQFGRIANPYIRAIFSKRGYWEESLLKSGSKEPFVDPLPIPPLIPGHVGVHVQSLQEQLAYWGYYRVRVDSVYNIQTADAVTSLQADLKDGGYYYHELDGIYTDHLHRAWLKFLESTDDGQNG